MESVGFKEWALVCEALGRGEQCVLLRKGGIAEGRKGFAFLHREFFLFPTFFHEQIGQTRAKGTADLPEKRTGAVEIRFFGKLELSGVVTSLETAEALEPFHILKPEVVRERFQYDEAPGIHVALVRVYRLSTPWIFPERPSYGGCRSWVKLPAAPVEMKVEAVLSDEEHASRSEAVRAIIDLRARATV